jgi:hypothetical protein
MSTQNVPASLMLSKVCPFTASTGLALENENVNPPNLPNGVPLSSLFYREIIGASLNSVSVLQPCPVPQTFKRTVTLFRLPSLLPFSMHTLNAHICLPTTSLSTFIGVAHASVAGNVCPFTARIRLVFVGTTTQNRSAMNANPFGLCWRDQLDPSLLGQRKQVDIMGHITERRGTNLITGEFVLSRTNANCASTRIVAGSECRLPCRLPFCFSTTARSTLQNKRTSEQDHHRGFAVGGKLVSQGSTLTTTLYSLKAKKHL